MDPSPMDDLRQIGNLRQYVKASQSILVFLSKGYFQSGNCMKELRATCELKKEIILVREMDTAKGGITIEEAKRDCPADLRAHVFKEKAIDWHRVEARRKF